MNLQEYSKAMRNVFSRFDGEIEKHFSKVDNDFFERIKKDILAAKLEKDPQGNIKPSISNRTKVAKIIRQAYVLDDYTKFSRTISSNINDVRFVTNAYISKIFDISRTFIEDTEDFNKKLLLDEFTRAAPLTSRLNIVDEVVKYSNNTLVSKNGLDDFIKGLNNKIVTESISTKVFNKFVATAPNAYARRVHLDVANKINSRYFLYSFGTVEDTRDFCKERNGKIFHELEIREWSDDSWQGKNKDTNESNIFFLLGGYNCQHILIAVPIQQVPKSVIERAVEKYGDKA